MDVSQFDFDLPEDRIALRPASPRDNARLLRVVAGGAISDHKVTDLADLLRPGDVLVLNDTRVIPAALTAVRPARAHGGGGDVALDINLFEPVSENGWKAFARPAKRLKVGDDLNFSEGLSAGVTDIQPGGQVALAFNQSGDALTRAIAETGAPPLPPYIARRRTPDENDVSDYQTIFAKDGQSVAAPTAGLHFTPRVFEALRVRGVKLAYVTLTVGAGTFLPVTADDTDDHIMHSEWFEISDETAQIINDAKQASGRVIAVGTTSLRALESASRDGCLVAARTATDIFITPGYKFKIVDGLMTNFHLPRSTLFMLVSALSGLKEMQAAYAHAIDTGYRFYSYGDASLLWKSSP